MTEGIEKKLSLAFLVVLILWGGWSLISYMGIPIHDLVLVNDKMNVQLQQLCDHPVKDDPGTGFICRGLLSIPPAVAFAFSDRLEPLFWFVILSIVLYGCFLTWRALQNSEWRLRGTLRVWHPIALFFVILWLMFSVLSRTLGSEQNPMRILYEPLPQVYVSATQSELQVLQKNKNDLQARGCLTEIGITPHNAKIYRISEFCVQSSFFTRVLPPLLFLFLFTIESILLGSFLFTLLRLRFESGLLHALMSAGLGTGVWTVILWTLAQLSLYTASFVWPLFVLIPLLSFREAIEWWKKIRSAEIHVDLPWWSGRTVLLWCLLALLALNFLYVLRPFPIGWDDLGRYVNQPRLLVSYGKAIPTMGTFQWEYITSLGFLLFGYQSTLGATISLELNWLAGVFAIVSVYAVSRTILGPGAGVLAALLYYITPVVGHFSFNDMKTDNAVFAMGTLALLAAFLWLVPSLQHHDEEEEGEETFGNWRLLLLSGVLTGLAFGFKATSIMTAMVIGALIVRGAFKRLGLLGASLLIIAVYIYQGNLNVSNLASRIANSPVVVSKTLVLAIFALLGIGCMVYGARLYSKNVKTLLKALAIYAAGFLVMIIPWMTVNSFKAGDAYPHLRFSPPNTLGAVFQLNDSNPLGSQGQVVRKLPKDLQVDLSNPACVQSGAKEELDRYWGYSKGISHYLTLPWRAVMDRDSPGYYVTELPGVLLFPLLLLLPFFWTKRGRGTALLFWATTILIVQWIFLASGVPWYGIGMFLGLSVAMEIFVRRSPSRSSHIIAWVLAIASLIIGFSMRMWQLDMQRSIFEYPMGKVSADVLRERTIPRYDDVSDIIVERARLYPESPYVYRMGTFIPYFIPKNLELLPISDNQLDTFNCLNQEKNHALTLRRLQALGFNSLIFDTNTATIEKEKEGTLHKKVNGLIDFLNDATLGITPIVNDNAAGMAFVLLPIPQ